MLQETKPALFWRIHQGLPLFTPSYRYPRPTGRAVLIYLPSSSQKNCRNMVPQSPSPLLPFPAGPTRKKVGSARLCAVHEETDKREAQGQVYTATSFW